MGIIFALLRDCAKITLFVAGVFSLEQVGFSEGLLEAYPYLEIDSLSRATNYAFAFFASSLLPREWIAVV